jgi:lipopolysaccharide assembly outer membrane protein LptD (OstA)
MKFLLSVLFAITLSFIAFAQQTDTLTTVLSDTTFTIDPDTVLTEKPARKSDVDTVVYANASDSLIYFVKDRKMALYGDGEITYKKTEITAANIFIDFEKYDLEAIGVPKDSTKDELAGTPVLSEAGEVYEGTRMTYNFKTGQGSLSAADTEIEGAFYHGEKIKKVSKDTYFIKDGVYTTCDEDCPHYHFYSPRMKVIQEEQLAAEWIWLNFGDVPVPVPIPFIIIPLQSGRRSGIIPPVFGNDARYGTYFSRFGYFWAISDYMDINATMDYYTRGSFGLYSRFRYANRYNYTGSVDASYRDFTQGESTDPDFREEIEWRLKWFHNQSFTPTLKLDVNLEFASQNFLQSGTVNFNDILRNEIISNATLSKTWEESGNSASIISKTWEESGNSASINYNRRQVIQTNDIYETLPSFLFRKAQSYPFRSSDSEQDRNWYELFGYSYTGQFQNRRNKVGGDLDIRGGIQHNLNADMSPKIGFFSFSPRVRYTEKWYNKQVEKFSLESSTGADSLITNDVKKISFVRTFDVGISTSTKFYGMLNINSLGLDAMRHTVTPSLSYSYRPDFSDPKWGYFGEYSTLDGNTVKYNKYEREVYGGATSGEQQNLNFSIGNNFELKTLADPTDTTSKANKIQLLNLTLGMGYNFAADSLNFSDLNLTYRTQVSDFFDLSGSSRFTLYDYAPGISRINKFLIDAGKGLLRLTNLNFSVTTRLSGEKFASSEVEKPVDEFGLIEEQNQNVYQGIYNQSEPDFTIPWQISLTYNFNMNRQIPENEEIFSNLSGSISLSLTKNWKFDVTGSYDFDRKEFVAPQVRVSRDLHCWIMNFTWNPIGTYTGFRFEIRVKAPQLQDLKLTKQDQFFDTR